MKTFDYYGDYEKIGEEGVALLFHNHSELVDFEIKMWRGCFESIFNSIPPDIKGTYSGVMTSYQQEMFLNDKSEWFCSKGELSNLINRINMNNIPVFCHDPFIKLIELLSKSENNLEKITIKLLE